MPHSPAPSRRTVSVVVLALVFLALLILAPEVPLVIFAGILLAVFFCSGGAWIANRLGVARGWGIGIFLIGIIMVLAAAGLFAAPAISDQFDELAKQIPDAIENVRQRLEGYAWGKRILDGLSLSGLMSAGSGVASRAATSTFGALGNFVIILFIGLYIAVDPRLYWKGFRDLLAPSIRPRGEAAMNAAARTLRQWITAKLMSMTIVGILTGLGLWAIGIPLAFILGLIAALLAFIPNIGPVLGAVPALLLAAPEGAAAVGWVAAVYIAVQALESYAITPIIQQEKVSLPPALTIVAQLLLGVLFGILGLALATPLIAVVMTLTGMLYVDGFLEREADPAGDDGESGAGDR